MDPPKYVTIPLPGDRGVVEQHGDDVLGIVAAFTGEGEAVFTRIVARRHGIHVPGDDE